MRLIYGCAPCCSEEPGRDLRPKSIRKGVYIYIYIYIYIWRERERETYIVYIYIYIYTYDLRPKSKSPSKVGGRSADRL